MSSFFEADSAEDLWPQIMQGMRDINANCPHGNMKATQSRNGCTIELLHAMLHLRDPRQKWIFSRQPALNPAFALAEVLWILAGRQDSAFLNHWNPVLPRYAGSGETYPGAYGWRLNKEHGLNQLQRAYEIFKANPESRQVTLQIWKPSLDLPDTNGSPQNEDIPCNICSLLKVRDGQLHWSQIMRSNDLVLGLPHNLVQWTTMQEVLAGWLGLRLGSYTHFSDSLHIYESHWPQLNGEETPLSLDQGNFGNSDSFSIPHEEFQIVFKIVEAKADALRNPDLKAKEIKKLAIYENCPVAYQNMLLVLAADTARRSNWLEESEDIMGACTNPSYRLLWSRWVQRRTTESKTLVR